MGRTHVRSSVLEEKAEACSFSVEVTGPGSQASAARLQVSSLESSSSHWPGLPPATSESLRDRHSRALGPEETGQEGEGSKAGNRHGLPRNVVLFWGSLQRNTSWTPAASESLPNFSVGQSQGAFVVGPVLLHTAARAGVCACVCVGW